MQAKYSVALTAVVVMLGACGGGEQQQVDATPAATPTPAVAPADQAAMPAGQLPEGVTPAMVDEGKTLFHGAGICLTCHAPNGVGVTGLGPALNDAEWLHSDGSYDAIVSQVLKGVTAAESKTGVAMPAKGGSAITDDQVKAIAAYVYSLRG